MKYIKYLNINNLESRNSFSEILSFLSWEDGLCEHIMLDTYVCIYKYEPGLFTNFTKTIHKCFNGQFTYIERRSIYTLVPYNIQYISTLY